MSNIVTKSLLFASKTILLIFLVCASCLPEKAKTHPPEPEFTLEPRVILRPHSAGTPFWFEFTPQGLNLIPGPADAALDPFVPWPYALHTVAFLPEPSGSLYAGVNRWGIIKIQDKGTETALYYYEAGNDWENSAILSLFRYEENPMVLLGRDKFFTNNPAPAPDKLLWSITPTGGIQALSLPALEFYPPEQGWETIALFQTGTAWYFRAVLPEQQNVFLISRDLSLAAVETSPENYAQAQEEVSFAPPPLLAMVMSEAERLFDCASLAMVVSPEYSGKRLYRTGTSAAEKEFFGFYRSPNIEGGGAAILLSSDGKGVYCLSNDETQREGTFNLPPIGAEKIVYTGIALAGNNLLAASWEEKLDWSIGAAGIMVLRMDW